MPQRESQPPADRWVQHEVGEEDAGRTVREVLTRRLHVSRRMIQRLTRSEGIRLNRRPTFVNRKVRAGDVLAARVSLREEGGLRPVEMELVLAYEDRDLLVIDKPAGLLTHPISPRHIRTLAHGVAHHFQERGIQAKVRPVHRLDRDTSGLILFAKSAFAHQQMDRQLRRREMRREYLALVAGRVEADAGEIDAPIAVHHASPTLRAVREGGETALTRYRVRERLPGATLLELELETGRTHQIRVHLSHLGHPLLGDAEYGGPPAEGLERQALHAFRLAFRPPSAEELVELTSSLPTDLARLRERLLEGG